MGCTFGAIEIPQARRVEIDFRRVSAMVRMKCHPQRQCIGPLLPQRGLGVNDVTAPNKPQQHCRGQGQHAVPYPGSSGRVGRPSVLNAALATKNSPSKQERARADVAEGSTDRPAGSRAKALATCV